MSQLDQENQIQELVVMQKHYLAALMLQLINQAPSG